MDPLEERLDWSLEEIRSQWGARFGYFEQRVLAYLAIRLECVSPFQLGLSKRLWQIYLIVPAAAVG